MHKHMYMHRRTDRQTVIHVPKYGQHDRGSSHESPVGPEVREVSPNEIHQQFVIEAEIECLVVQELWSKADHGIMDAIELTGPYYTDHMGRPEAERERER